MGKRKSITERIASSKIVKAGMSIALALSVCASVPASALAAEQVKVTVGGDIPYAGYFTTNMWADGEIAYCADPAASTPAPGTYVKTAEDGNLAAAMWFSYGAPGFDKSMFPASWYDGSGWTCLLYTSCPTACAPSASSRCWRPPATACTPTSSAA